VASEDVSYVWCERVADEDVGGCGGVCVGGASVVVSAANNYFEQSMHKSG
jgi:hypothetical protein